MNQSYLRMKKKWGISIIVTVQNQDTLRHAIFHEILNLAFIQKAWHFALRDVFIYKNPDTSQKENNLRYVFMYKMRTLCFTWFLSGAVTTHIVTDLYTGQLQTVPKIKVQYQLYPKLT